MKNNFVVIKTFTIFADVRQLEALKIMKKISICDFVREYVYAGHYEVTYTSPMTGKKWRALVTCMPMIDATFNAEEPKRKDLESLKRFCKDYGTKLN